MSEEIVKRLNGYKVLSSKQSNMFGKTFEEGHTYETDEEKSLRGYYFCLALADALAFSPRVSLTRDVKVARVTGEDCTLDKHKAYYGDYYGIDDIYYCRRLTINSFLTYDDIASQMLQDSELKLKFYFANLMLERETIVEIIEKYRNNVNVMYALLYHQLGCRDIYEIEAGEARKRVKDVVNRWTK